MSIKKSDEKNIHVGVSKVGSNFYKGLKPRSLL